jgi:hypothetical protein
MSRWEHRYLGQERFPDALSAMEIEALAKQALFYIPIQDIILYRPTG